MGALDILNGTGSYFLSFPATSDTELANAKQSAKQIRSIRPKPLPIFRHFQNVITVADCQLQIVKTTADCCRSWQTWQIVSVNIVCVPPDFCGFMTGI